MAFSWRIASLIAAAAIAVMMSTQMTSAQSTNQVAPSQSEIDAATAQHRNWVIAGVIWTLIASGGAALIAFMAWHASNTRQKLASLSASARIEEARAESARANATTEALRLEVEKQRAITADAQQKAAEAQQRATEAERITAQLKDREADPTAVQKRGDAPTDSINVEAHGDGTDEPEKLAKTVVEALRAGGCDANLTFSAFLTDGSQRGVRVVGPDDRGRAAILEILKAASVQATDGGRQELYRVIVGSRPPVK